LSSAAAANESATPAPTADGADTAKTECLSRYEEAQVARRARRLLDSRAALRACSGVACPSAIRADCVDWLDQVSHSIPSLVVTARARGADVLDVKVFIDGKLATERLTGFALEIDPGLHKFRFESPPWPVIEREILASEGVKDRPIEVEFAPPLPTAAQLAARETAPKPFRLERSDYVFGGIALAGFATLAYFGGTGLYDAHHSETTCGSYCSPSHVDAIRTKLVIADIGMAVAFVALALGLYFHGKGKL
ncbi:MAG TPA: hypothetical protein VNG89_12730, partial [Vicinamibacterales bacterium]|nr:hypothetical protein [Vicinamibacterales bacterium]